MAIMAIAKELHGLPTPGWQHRTLPILADLTQTDDRIHELRTYGSAAVEGAGTDPWSDLDVLLRADEPEAVADDLTQRIASEIAPVFAFSRDDSPGRYGIRLVLRDLRRLDITVEGARSTTPPSSSPPKRQSGSELAGIANAFRFDAVLAATRAARQDMLIGSHLTLQLPRHLLVVAMILRDRHAGTTHHRFGGSRWDLWVTRLSDAPDPYTRGGLTAAIRFYLPVLDELLAEEEPEVITDNSPLWVLLDEVDAA